MEKMAVLGIEIAQTIEAPRKNYQLRVDGEAYYLSLTNDQINFLNWLDDYGMLSYNFAIEKLEDIAFEKV